MAKAPTVEQLKQTLEFLGPRLRRVWRGYQLRPEDAEELLQDVFMITLLKLRSAVIKNLEGWIFIVLRNQCIQFLKRERVRRRFEVLGSSWIAEAEIPESIDLDLALALQLSLAALGPKHRLVVSLRLAGYSSAEVALRTGYCEGSVRKIFSRAAGRLAVGLPD